MRLQSSYKVGIYCRLSRDDNNGNAESMSIANQRDLIKTYVNEKGWEIADIYVDDGYSGTTFERPDFLRMIRDIEVKKIDMVITKDLSRLGRNYIMTGQYTDFYFPQNGVRFIALNDNVDTVQGDNDIAPFKNILNEMYAKDISKKIRSSRLVSARQGKFMGSVVPYGYKRSSADKHILNIDEETAPVVRRIFSLYAVGESGRSIAEKLNEEGLLSPRALYYRQVGREKAIQNQRDHWGANSIYQMLRNEVYIGKMVQGKRRVVSFKTKQREVPPKDEWISIENTHEPIIDEDLWDLVQKRVQAQKRIQSNKKSEVSLFSGIVKCADCGGALAYNVKEHAHTSYNTYRCSTYSNSGSCSIHSISAELLERVVFEELKVYARLAKEQEDILVERLIEKIKGSKKHQIARERANISNYKKRLQTINQNVKILFEEKCSGNIPSEIFKQLMEQYEKERQVIKNDYETLEQKVSSFCETENDAHKWVNLVRQHLEMEKLTRQALVQLIDHIDVYERKKVNGICEQEIRIYYRFIGCLSERHAVQEISA